VKKVEVARLIIKPIGDVGAPVRTGRMLRVTQMTGRKTNWSATASIDGWTIGVGKRDGDDGRLTVSFTVKSVRVPKP